MHYLERIREEGRDANPFFRLMGVGVDHVEKGTATIRMTVRPDMQNGEGFLQGGMFTALADEAMALAIYSVLEHGETIATITESTSFLKGIREGTVTAEGIVVRKGRRVVFAEGIVRTRRDGGEVVLSKTTAAYALTRSG
ncbi:MAG: PaaI family thioesterase [Methanoregulaceae archaeon]|nr:PaaI family thioesterase [Methanoregulaceae archaeon]